MTSPERVMLAEEIKDYLKNDMAATNEVNGLAALKKLAYAAGVRLSTVRLAINGKPINHIEEGLIREIIRKRKEEGTPGEAIKEPTDLGERAESKLTVTGDGCSLQMNEPASHAFALGVENAKLNAELETMRGEKERLEKALQEAEEEANNLKDEKIGAACCHHQEMRDLKAKAFDILAKCLLPR